MKFVRDLSRTELIEIIAAVSLRISGFVYLISATREGFRFTHYASERVGSMDTYTAKAYEMDIAYDVVTALLMLVLTLPLSRLLCRELETIVDTPAMMEDRSHEN